MRVSTGWIKELLCRTISDDQVIEALERAGVEVEQYSYSKSFDQKLVVGVVKKVVQHPEADRLRIATVDSGREELTIVCGAPNVREGLHAPLAQIGAVLPDGTKITASKLRGVMSEGMLCSGRELGLSEDHDGLLELPDSTKAGDLLCDMYPSDGIADLKTAANRFDVQSAIGLAREVAAMTDDKLKLPPVGQVSGKTDDEGLVGVLDADCPRFMITELEVSGELTSPQWMVARLAAAGIRSLGLLVDVTNYVMLETGQPMHAYDAKNITLPFAVRRAHAKEQLETLDGQDRILSSEDLVVTAGDVVVGLAGVRGGAAAEVRPDTSHVYLEAATFAAPAIRLAAKRANLRTDASARYERGLPVELAEQAMARATQLLMELADAKIIRHGEAGTGVLSPRRVTLNTKQASRIIGLEQTPKGLIEGLNRFGMVAVAQGDDVVATIPWWRPDIMEPEDLIEEMVRLIGYANIPAQLPAWRPKDVQFDRRRPAVARLRELLSGGGLFEVMTYSFVAQEQLEIAGLVPDDHLKLQNPLSAEQAYLRTTLLASHLAVAARNRLYNKSLGFYELSGVFVPTKPGVQPLEPQRLGLMIVSPAESYRAVKGWLDGLAMLANVEFELTVSGLDQPWAPGRVADISLNGAKIGRIGQLHPSVVTAQKLVGEAAYMELDLEPILASWQPRQAATRSRFPEARRDVTVVLPTEVTWQMVAEALVQVSGVHVEFASDYIGSETPAGHKSLAIKLRISSFDHTPTEAEAAELETKVRSILHRQFKARD